MKVVLPMFTFFMRHFFFVLLAMIVGCIIWAVVYLVLLAIAIVANQGLGGPLAFPAGMLAVVMACAALGWGVFAPASAMGALFCGVFRLPRVAAIPVVCAAAFMLSYLLYWVFIERGTTHPMPSIWNMLKNFVIYLSIPLGAYWWLTEGPGALFDAFRRWTKSRRLNKTRSQIG